MRGRKGFTYSYFAILYTMVLLLLLLPSLINNSPPTLVSREQPNLDELYFISASRMVAYSSQATINVGEVPNPCPAPAYNTGLNILSDSFKQNLWDYAKDLAANPDITEELRLIAEVAQSSVVQVSGRCIENTDSLVRETVKVGVLMNPEPVNGSTYIVEYSVGLSYNISVTSPEYSIYDWMQVINITRNSTFSITMLTLTPGGPEEYKLMEKQYTVPIYNVAFTCTPVAGPPVEYDLKYDIQVNGDKITLTALYNPECQYKIAIDYLDGLRILLVYSKAG